jgi:hypothetical protein
MVQLIYVSLIIPPSTQVCEQVRLGKEKENEDLVVHRQRAPYYGQEEGCGGRYEAEEEDEDGGVLVVHKVVAQLGAAVGDAAIGKVEVEAA